MLQNIVGVLKNTTFVASVGWNLSPKIRISILNSMKIAIIGAGNMGSAIARGILSATSAHEVWISNPSAGKLTALKGDYPEVQTTSSNLEAVHDAHLIILAVKPWLIAEVIREIAPNIDACKQVVASLAGGMSIDDVASCFRAADAKVPPLCVVMPNTAIAVGSSMTFIATREVPADAEQAIVALFSTMGKVKLIPERLLPAATSLASCGIAFALRYVRAAMEGGVELGFTPRDAQEIVAQTLQGAIDLLAQEGAHPETEIDKVTTAGGLTIRGLNAMEQAGFTHSVQQGLRAAVK